MSQAIEIKIKISNDEQTYTKKFLCYETITLSKEDAELKKMVEGAVKEFKGPIDDVKVVSMMMW